MDAANANRHAAGLVLVKIELARGHRGDDRTGEDR